MEVKKALLNAAGIDWYASRGRLFIFNPAAPNGSAMGRWMPCPRNLRAFIINRR